MGPSPTPPAATAVRGCSRGSSGTGKSLASLPLAAVLLLCCLGPALAAVQPGDTLVPDNIFYQQLPNGALTTLAQGVELEGDLLRSIDASTPAACAQACYNDPDCQLFGHTQCHSEGGQVR